MITNWFKTKNVNVVVEESNILQKEEKIITSKDIQEDLYKSFEDVIKDFGLKESKETEIIKLQSKLDNFKTENIEVYNKIETLQNLGLTSTPSVVKSLQTLKDREAKINAEVETINKEIQEAETLKNLISEYSLKYPFYKFIDEKTMFNIMEKYDLVLGDAFMYGREIPNDNLQIINYFTSEIKDSEEIMQLIGEYFSMGNTHYCFSKKEKVVVDKSFNEQDYYLQMSFNHKKTVVEEFKVSKFKIVAPETHFIIPTHETVDFRGVHKDVPILSLGSDRKYKFDLRELEKIEAKKREVLDPIACLEVEGGYIIMTAWDKEAEIPEIKNNMLN